MDFEISESGGAAEYFHSLPEVPLLLSEEEDEDNQNYEEFSEGFERVSCDGLPLDNPLSARPTKEECKISDGMYKSLGLPTPIPISASLSERKDSIPNDTSDDGSDSGERKLWDSTGEVLQDLEDESNAEVEKPKQIEDRKGYPNSVRSNFIPNLRERVLSRGKRESRDIKRITVGEGEEGEEEEEETESCSTVPTAVSRSRGGGRYVSTEGNDEIDGTEAGSDRESSEEEAPIPSPRFFNSLLPTGAQATFNTKDSGVGLSGPPVGLPFGGSDRPLENLRIAAQGDVPRPMNQRIIDQSYFLLSLAPPELDLDLERELSPHQSRKLSEVMTEIEKFLREDSPEMSTEVVFDKIQSKRALFLDRIEMLKFLTCVLRDLGSRRVSPLDKIDLIFSDRNNLLVPEYCRI
jgi:hypothetical protein